MTQQIYDKQGLPQVVFPYGRGTLSHGQATVTAASTLRSANIARRSISIRNLGAGTLYVGGSGVGTTDGYPLTTNEALTLTRHTDPIYVNVSASCDVRFIEELSA